MISINGVPQYYYNIDNIVPKGNTVVIIIIITRKMSRCSPKSLGAESLKVQPELINTERLFLLCQRLSSAMVVKKTRIV